MLKTHEDLYYYSKIPGVPFHSRYILLFSKCNCFCYREAEIMFIVDGPFLTYFQSVELKFQYCSSKHESLVLILERGKKKKLSSGGCFLSD